MSQSEFLNDPATSRLARPARDHCNGVQDGLGLAICLLSGLVFLASEGTLQSAIVLNGHESDGGRDDRTT
jgi:hypothetical protein